MQLNKLVAKNLMEIMLIWHKSVYGYKMEKLLCQRRGL